MPIILDISRYLENPVLKGAEYSVVLLTWVLRPILDEMYKTSSFRKSSVTLFNKCALTILKFGLRARFSSEWGSHFEYFLGKRFARLQIVGELPANR